MTNTSTTDHARWPKLQQDTLLTDQGPGTVGDMRVPACHASIHLQKHRNCWNVLQGWHHRVSPQSAETALRILQ